MADLAKEWQLRLYEKTLKKKEKVNLLSSLLPSLEGLRCLDLGCSAGTVSYWMRQKGGVWISVDLDLANLVSAKKLVDENVVRIGPKRLPFADQSFDLVLTLDFIEHVTDDELCMDEIVRVLKPGGLLLLSAPSSYKFQVLNWLKCRIGMTPDVYGHMREGYSLGAMQAMLHQRKLEVAHRSTYSRFFTEAIELALNVGYRLLKKGGDSEKRTGNITPTSEEELRSVQKSFRLYSKIYPFTFAFSKLDRLIPFLKGYAILLCAFKPVWQNQNPSPIKERWMQSQTNSFTKMV